jgi:hypothetical protein
MKPERARLSSILRVAATVGLLLGATDAWSDPLCTYGLTPASAALPTAGGSGLVSVTAPAGCFWQARSQAPWISTLGSGGGSGSVGYYVAANTGGPRSGSIDIAGQAFTITQAAAPCTYSISPGHAAFPSGGGSGSVTVMAPGWCSWEASSQAPWINVSTIGSGSTALSYSVSPNPAAMSRSGSIAIAGQTHTVTQEGTPTIAPPPGVDAPVLQAAGDRFAVDGSPRFLLFVSYYDALRVSPAALEEDLAYLKSRGIDGIRILPNWFHFRCGGLSTPADDDGLFTPTGLRHSRWEAFVHVLQRAAAHRLLVDATFTRDTIQGIGVAAYEAQIQEVARLLAGSYRHVLFDLQNEHDLAGPESSVIPRLTREQVRSIANGITDNQRLVTVSTSGGADREAGEVAAFAGLEVVALHPDRSGSWYSFDIGEAVSDARAGQGGAFRPAYLQEPMPFSFFVDPDPSLGSCGNLADSDPSRHRQAVVTARAAGAAAYTFHTRTTFGLLDVGYASRLADLGQERSTLESLREWADSSPAANERLVSLKSWNGFFVAAELGPGSEPLVKADRGSAGPWETFVLHDLNGGSLMSGDQVTFRTTVPNPNLDNERVYLQAEANGEPEDARLLAAGRQEGPYETFVIAKPGGGEIQDLDEVSLKTAHNPYFVMAEEGGGPPRSEGADRDYLVRVHSHAAGPWEMFRLLFR